MMIAYLSIGLTTFTAFIVYDLVTGGRDQEVEEESSPFNPQVNPFSTTRFKSGNLTEEDLK
jgi:hypothetical protein